MKVNDITDKVLIFEEKRNIEHRYSSFDFCYNYFRSTENLTEDIEKSCLVLGFYLASWGMYRGSSFMLQKSAKHLEETIKYINSLDKSIWEIDVDDYTDENCEIILGIYKEIKARIIEEKKAHMTLVTKIMLGVFGFVPAYDSYFTKSFRYIYKDEKCRFRSFNKDSLKLIKKFYECNKNEIDTLSKKIYSNEFNEKSPQKYNYSKAKIIDMYGFTLGLEIN